MARYVGTLETARPAEEVFAYMSDFSSTQEWDPGVAEAQRLDSGPIGVGSEFRVLALFLNRKIPLIYRIVGYDPPRVTTLRAESSTVISLDTITVASAGGVTRITYDAELSLRGPLKLLDPVLRLVFDRLGDRALAGLRRTLDAPESGAPADP
jgi:carbon monoxide dehydrogenase subunit G